MFKSTILTVTFVLLFAVSNTALAQTPPGPAVYVDMNEVEGLIGGKIPAAGADYLKIPVRLINVDVARTVVSNGYCFSSTGVDYSGGQGDWNPAYPWDWEMAIALNEFPPYFDYFLGVHNYLDGYLPDTVGFVGMKLAGSGLPADFAGIAYFITLHDVEGAPGETLVMDSTWWEPANYWIWGGMVYPSWGGPYIFEVGDPVLEPPVITSDPVTWGATGISYSYDVEATGYPDPTFELTTAPTGMSINVSTGAISWTPETAGDYDVTVIATNSEGSDAQTYTIAVSASAIPEIVSEPVATASVGVPYTYNVEATGWPAPIFQLLVAPSGMTIDPVSGLINWTPTEGGYFSVSIKVSNVLGYDQQQFTISVPEALAFASTPVTWANVKQLYDYDVDAVGYPDPVYALTTYPVKMTIDRYTGLIEWTPTHVGRFEVVVEATNTHGTISQEFTIDVLPEDAFRPAVYINLDEVEGLVGGKIPEGGVDILKIPVRFASDDIVHGGLVNAYSISSTSVSYSGADAEWNPLYPWDWNLALELNQFPPYFEDGIFIHDFLDAVLPDTVAFVGLTLGEEGGMPADFEGIAYFITLHDVAGAPGEVLTIDSVSSNGLGRPYWYWYADDVVPVYWGGPFHFQIGPTPSTYLASETIYIREIDDRTILVLIENELNDIVDLNSIRINGKVPPYTPSEYPTIDDQGRIVTDCSVYRFLSAYRPISDPPIETEYTVTYNYNDGRSWTLTGEVVIDFTEGDLNLDGRVDDEDMEILADYVFKQGRPGVLEELMDINRDGECDIDDISALQDLIQQ